MPIRREDRHFYPIDWRELSAAIRFNRAKGRCERCGRPHGQLVYHLSDGRWFDNTAGRWRDNRGRLVRTKTPPDPRVSGDEGGIAQTFVRLACAHLDQNTANNADNNLAAFCQRCHLDHDRPWNIEKRRLTVLLRRALGDLFTGPYRR
ncbi:MULTISPECIES: hypothetical protein [Aurantimonadaceae]|uniref:Uncharacterized protein n=2 Tax=Jiella TaxID=1775688 RepID=A0A6N9T5T7_9HYPH|nr:MULTISPECIES: hypothetical protein [Aurantimonadaceae]MAU94321.1 hypothetical protein [Fulvimarina sp.]WAP71516.1 hypothetical protein OH818_28245 [Jiella pelagia]MAU95540.1 hypothetical protein [Fulvimarina sp.]NDW06744.1 hypothetical protein [Jiella pacifica]ORE97048.1 hypothetical protein ATO4_11124 [Aurantimonas sp. 22II-16-19i]|tara:strand:- start:1 stop:444 length:444 start_codon:yes stop_codon:yes gene_type:complete